MAVRIGFIGAGGIANMHMGALAGNPEAEMVAFCDPEVERARAAAKRYGGKAFKSHRTMFRKVDMDAVFICIPPFAHTDQIKLAVEAGCAVFTEKPIGLNMRRVAANAELIESKGIVSSVGYNWRYSDGAQMARKALAGERLAVCGGHWVGGTPGVYWWRQMKLSGGQIVEQTTHIFDLCRYIAGDVDTVFASGTTGSVTPDELPDYDVHDASVVQLRYKSGAVGTVTSSCIVPTGVDAAFYAYAKDLTVTVANSECVIARPGTKETYSDVTNPTAAEHQAFLAALQGTQGPPILSTYADGMETLRVTLAANKSMETGKPVRL